MASEPAGLDADGTAGDGPESSVLRNGFAAAWEAEREKLVTFSRPGTETMGEMVGRYEHGYIHCMPYGYVSSGPTPRPLEAVVLPVCFRLSPLQPGYVMTVCEVVRDERERRHAIIVARRGHGDEEERRVVEDGGSIAVLNFRYFPEE